MVQAFRAVLSGEIAGGADRWSTGAWFVDVEQAGPPLVADLQAWAVAIAAAIPTAVGGTLRNALSTSGNIDTVNTYYYPSLQGNAGIGGAATLDFPGLGTAVNPLPTSVVASLRTGLPGRRYRGRNYWPAVALAVSPNGRFSGVDMAALPGRFVDLFEAIQNAWVVPGQIQLGVASRTADQVTPVTSIQVGDVPDTQRRRRDALVEVYTSEAYAE